MSLFNRLMVVTGIVLIIAVNVMSIYEYYTIRESLTALEQRVEKFEHDHVLSHN